MFDFMDSDGFIIGLEIVFLTFVIYDAWKFYKTRRKEYVINIIMAVGFALWILVPFYTKYYDWTDEQRQSHKTQCLLEHNASYCACMDNLIEKSYTYDAYEKIDKKNDTGYKEFLIESKEECFGDSWF